MRLGWKKSYSILLIFSFVAGCQIGAVAGEQSQPDTRDELTQAQQWLSGGEYDKAYQAYLRQAETRDNPLAQFTLGLFHQHGWGIAMDAERACQWYEKAAHNGIPAASHFLGDCYQNGTHRPVDYPAAIRWYREAADAGHTVSLCSIAALMMDGKGVSKDPQQALNLCQQAASGDSIPAQLQLGQFYLQGDESIQDPLQAVQWFNYAAERGSPEAYYYLGRIFENRFNDTENALDRYEMAASQGYLPAYYSTARLYFNAPVDEETQSPIAENLAKAYMWLSATLRLSGKPDEIEAIKRMLTDVETIMPPAWKVELDQKVMQHLEAFHRAR